LRDGGEIEIQSSGASLPGYLASPVSGTGPGVLVIHEANGLDAFTRDVCDRLARAGFAALAPDLYRGEAADTHEGSLRLAAGLEAEGVARDLLAAEGQLLGERAVTGPRVGVVGFCMGGHVALLAGAVSPRVAAIVDFYGLGELPVDVAKLAAPVLGIFAGDDEFIPAGRVDALRAELEAAGVSAHLRVEPGVGHGFMNHTRAERFDASAAAAGWDRMLAFLRAELV
jgi:carboxymethylenebutenolidase